MPYLLVISVLQSWIHLIIIKSSRLCEPQEPTRFIPFHTRISFAELKEYIFQTPAYITNNIAQDKYLDKRFQW